jgi:hypothetical protein
LDHDVVVPPRTSSVSFHTIPPLWRADADFIADFVFILEEVR